MIDISRLHGAELDAAVARIVGIDHEMSDDGSACFRILPSDEFIGAYDFVQWSPSTNWSQGGPIIEEERGAINPEIQGDGSVVWVARMGAGVNRRQSIGPTPLIAAMRAFVDSKQ